MKPPCDEAVVRSGSSNALCRTQSRAWVLAATILGSSMAFIDGTVVNVALPALQSSLQATVVDVQWVVESYGLFLSALLLIGGALGDSVGRRSIFLLGTGVFAAASVGCGLSSNISQLIVARCVQGIGAAFLVPSSLAIISASFDEKSRGQAIGTWSGAHPQDIEALHSRLVSFFLDTMTEVDLVVPYGKEGVLADIRRNVHVLSESYEEKGVCLKVKVNPGTLTALKQRLAS
jgi:sugar phosphate permease